MVIIDSPGVGESDIMDEIVTQYLPQAFAFLYVINSANAGGVQKDRVSSSSLCFFCFYFCLEEGMGGVTQSTRPNSVCRFNL